MKSKRWIQGLAFGLSAVVLAVIVVVVIRFFLDPVAGLVLLAAATLALVAFRVSSRRVPRGTVLELDLEKGVGERTPADPIGRALARGRLSLRDLTDSLDRAAEDDRVVGIFARLGNGAIGIAQAQELRDAIQRFRAAGKTTVAYAETFGEGSMATVQYYLAAAFGEIHLLPNGELSTTGVISRVPFLGGFFSWLEATPDFDHRREYKAAKYLFTEDHFTEPHREAATAIMDSQLDTIVADIAHDRGLDAEEVRAAIDGAPLLAEEALELKLVDRLSYRDEALDVAKGDGGRLLLAARYLKRAGRPHRRGSPIALIYGVGTILRGEPKFDLLTQDSSMGADEVVDTFRRAVADKRVKAIVFRVDSRGGSAVASELVRRETIRAREAGKPVVVSMGNVAGSGGYWISAAADRIVAQPGTITGSIGVVVGKVATRQMWKRVGISWDEIHLGENATYDSPDDVYTDSELQRRTAFLDATYADFKTRVSEGRSLDPERVEEMAKGRAWSGADAHGLGLVDELGGVHRAVELAKELAGIPEDDRVKLIVYPKERLIRLPRRRESSDVPSEIMGGIAAAADILVGSASTARYAVWAGRQ